MKASEEKWIVYLSTYPPRECGIATFTYDLVKSFDELFLGNNETKIIAMNTDVHAYRYSSKVIFQIRENNVRDYETVAEKLNKMRQVKLVAIQHEYGIFGDNFGEKLLVFLEKLQKPVTVTFHTILPNPQEEMKNVTQKIIERAERIIVMTQSAKQIFLSLYGVEDSKIKVIPHGIHPLAYNDGDAAKKSLRLGEKKILSTFGLLNRGKGIEYAIEALPKIIKTYPNAIYLIIGETHPVVRRTEGEIYRNELIKKAYELGVADHVFFYNKYFEINELLKFLQATDIYLSLSQNPNQAVSGTFTYALGAGRPVISTPFMQAKEVIVPELGMLVDFHNSKDVAKEVINLFGDKSRLISMGKAAYFRTRGMVWHNVALSHMKEFADIVPDLEKTEKILPPLRLTHLSHLSDDFGIIQFAVLDKPDHSSGYTIDDNARALVAMVWLLNIHKNRAAERLAGIYFKFLKIASKTEGGFENYFTFDRVAHSDRNKQENLEEADARALWATAVASASESVGATRNKARTLFINEFSKIQIKKSPRAAAFYIKGLVVWLNLNKDEKAEALLKENANFLLDIFNRTASDEWQWFEEILAYSNAVIPEALLLAYKITDRKEYFDVGKKSLDFLISNSFESGVCRPIGQAGWFRRGEKKYLFDQQPEEVSALVIALRTMLDISNDTFYREKMTQAFNWFLGNNALNQVVCVHATGACYDGIGEKEVNLNQGAESTIAYLLARLAMEEKAK